PVSHPPPRATLVPYTTLFRSDQDIQHPGWGSPGCGCRTEDQSRTSAGKDSENHGQVARHHGRSAAGNGVVRGEKSFEPGGCERKDRKSTRLNSSHVKISYAVF